MPPPSFIPTSPRPTLVGLLVRGAAAGFLAGLPMLLVMVVMRNVFGVATPIEMIFDRLFPFLTVDFFIASLVRAGGYTPLKLQGVYGALAGQAAVAAAGGMIYALFPRFAPPARRGWWLVAPGVVAAWALFVVLLWPNLLTSFHGHPPAQARLITSLVMLLDFAVCGVGIMFFDWLLAGRETPAPNAAAVQPGVTRRAFLAGGIGAGAALITGGLLYRLYRLGSFFYDGTQYGGPGVVKITPTDQFYQVTKNLVDPDVARAIWRFDLVGNVEIPRAWSFAELTALPSVEQETTLQCIAYNVGSGLISNALWKGVPLPALLAVAVPKPDTVAVLFHAADGFFETIPYSKAQEPTTLVAWEMNGEPLPPHHGFPMRLIVPGVYGERNAKWVTRLELLSRDDPRLKLNRHGIEGVGFYTEQGWGPNIFVPTTSRIDAPRVEGDHFERPFKLGQPVEFRGMAHGGDRGIRRVEISTDGGRTYAPVEIHAPGTKISWSLWRYTWTPGQPTDETRIVVRAVDGDDQPQIEEPRNSVPHGATGLHSVRARVERG